MCKGALKSCAFQGLPRTKLHPPFHGLAVANSPLGPESRLDPLRRVATGRDWQSTAFECAENQATTLPNGPAHKIIILCRVIIPAAPREKHQLPDDHYGVTGGRKSRPASRQPVLLTSVPPDEKLLPAARFKFTC